MTSSTKTVAWTADDIRRAKSGLMWIVGDVLFTFYRIEGVRSGAMGVVYLCRHVVDDTRCAFKTVRIDPLLDPHARDLMTAEAESWLHLDPHPNIVTCEYVFDSPHDKRLWLQLECVSGDPVRGTTLQEWMQHGGWDLESVVRVAGGICEAMQYVAARGLVHRDLKPANVLMTKTGCAKVTDFGLAQPHTANDGGRDSGIAGSPAYMAPEAWSPDSPRSSARDVYAFGIILWELLAGHHPFAGRADIQKAHAETQPDDPSSLKAEVPAWLGRMALTCLAKNPYDRPTFADLLVALRAERVDPPWFDPGDRDAVPSRALDDFFRIDSLIKLARYDEAERCLAEALQRDSEAFLLHFARFRLFKETGRLSHADASLERLAREQTDFPDDLLIVSEALRYLGRLDEALTTIDRALEREPDRAPFQLERGRVLWHLGRHDDALRMLERAAAHKTESGGDALTTMAQIAASGGRHADAERYLKEALSRNPHDERALCEHARVLLLLGRPSDAVNSARRACEVDSRSSGAHCVLADALEATGAAAEAVQVLRGLTARTLASVEAWSKLGLLLAQVGSATESNHAIQQALHCQAQTTLDWMEKGHLQVLFGDLRGALESFTNATAMEPAFADAWAAVADTHIHLREVDAAIDVYRRALGITSDASAIRNKLAAALALSRGNTVLAQSAADALEHYKLAVEKNPDNGTILFAAATALTLLGRGGEALPLLDRASGLGRFLSTRVRWLKVQCLAMLRLVDEARQLAREVLPEVADPRRRELLERISTTSDEPIYPRSRLAWTWYHAAIQAEQQKRSADAEEFFRRAVYVDPNTPAHRAGLGFHLLIMSDTRAGAFEEGVALSERALEESGRDPDLLFNYAQGLLIAGHPAEALRLGEELRSTSPANPLLIELIARAKSQLADDDRHPS